MKKGQSPPWKRQLEERKKKAVATAEEFKKLGINCIINDDGSITIKGSEFAKKLEG